MDTHTEPMPARVATDRPALPFTGKRRPLITKTCACCGETFKTRFSRQKFLNDRHRDRYYRRK